MLTIVVHYKIDSFSNDTINIQDSYSQNDGGGPLGEYSL